MAQWVIAALAAIARWFVPWVKPPANDDDDD